MGSLQSRLAITALGITALLGMASAARALDRHEDIRPPSGAVAGPASPQSSIKVTPRTVRAGRSVTVHGYVRGCPNEVTLLSRAFSHEKEFAGVPMITAKITDEDGNFSRRTTIPKLRRAGRYSVTGRCGGGNVGAQATLRVLRHGR